MKSLLLKPTADTVVHVKEDTQFVLDLANSDMAEPYSVTLVFDTEGVEAEILGLYKLLAGKSIKLVTSAQHTVPHTKCNTIVRGVLSERSKSDYIGKIVIEKPAQQTSSYLDDSVLVAGQDTHNNSQPILEIEADDVKASHGATTGQVDPSQIYYLKSRGFNEEESKSMIIDGFLQSGVNKILDLDMKKKVAVSLGIQGSLDVEGI